MPQEPGAGVMEVRGGPGPLALPHPEWHLFDLFYMLDLNVNYLENHILWQVKKTCIETHATRNSVPSSLLRGWRQQC